MGLKKFIINSYSTVHRTASCTRNLLGLQESRRFMLWLHGFCCAKQSCNWLRIFRMNLLHLNSRGVRQTTSQSREYSNPCIIGHINSQHEQMHKYYKHTSKYNSHKDSEILRSLSDRPHFTHQTSIYRTQMNYQVCRRAFLTLVHLLVLTIKLLS